MDKVKSFKKNTIIVNSLIYFLLLTFSFSLLYICTASSPRYATNPWNDANAFLTMGRAMSSGLTIYKDIFEQKGPLLYLLHAVASLISDSSFLGVYIIQSLFLSATAFAAYKIASLYVGTAWSVISAVLTCFVTVNSGCYYYGDSAEEFCLPLLMISIYFFCRYFRNTEQNELGKSVFLLVGFFAGCVAMIKFTVIGFWFAWAAYILLYIWIAKKNFKKAFVNAMIFLCGMALAVAPWIVYFAVKGALYDFINTYFVLNATAYPKTQNLSIIGRITQPVYHIFEAITFSPVVLVLAVISNLLFLFTNIFTTKKFFSRISIPFVCFLGMYLIYFGLRSYAYYFIPMSVFTIFSFISVGALLQKIFKKKKRIIFAVLSVAVIASTLTTSNFINLSSKYASRANEQIAQEKIANYIKEKNPDGALLNYGCLDLGVYLLANQVPKFRHFEHQNFVYENFKENADEQNRYINEHLSYYVVTSDSNVYEKNPTLKTDYNLVLCEESSIQSSTKADKKIIKSFYLFELKEK